MITKQELKEVLQKYQFDEKQVDRILNKRIKTLLKNGNKDKIDIILQILLDDTYDISRKAIEKCLTVLALGKVEEIKRIFKVLKNHAIDKETIEKCLSVLARGKADEIEKIFIVLDEHQISKEAIEGCLTVLANGKADEIEKIFEVLDRYNIDKETIEKCLYVFVGGKTEEEVGEKAKKIDDILNYLLNEQEISKGKIEECLTLLAIGNLDEIKRIFKVLNNHTIAKEKIEECLIVLAEGKADEIERIFKVLNDYEISKEAIEGCLTVLAVGKADEIEKIFKVLKDYKISKKAIERCLSVLARGKADEIEKIFIVLKEYQIPKEAIEGCLSVLAVGKADEIEKILQVLLKDHKISKEATEGCLTILAHGKADEIEKIFEVLDEHEITKEKIEGCLHALASGKVAKVKKTFKILDDNEIEKEQINNNLGFILSKDPKEIKKIFTEGSAYLKRYMQLKGYYDRIISEAEIQEICKEKKVSERQFFKIIRGEDYPETYQETYQETVKRKGGIYIGKSIPMDESYIDHNMTILLNLSKRVARNFGYKYYIRDIPELESQAIEIIINKCGDIVYNLDWNPELLKRAIYSKTYNYLKVNLKVKEMLQDFSTSEIEREKRFRNDSGEKEEELDLTNWKINEEQENILRYISMNLENGYELSEAIQNVADMLNVDEEEILKQIIQIREQNSENEIRMGEKEELS